MELKAQTQSTLSEMTPDKALNLLKEGNQRFLEGQKAQRNLLEQMAIRVRANFRLQWYWDVSTPVCRRS